MDIQHNCIAVVRLLSTAIIGLMSLRMLVEWVRNYFLVMQTHLAESSSASLLASNIPHRRRWSIKQMRRTWYPTVSCNKGRPKLWNISLPSHLGLRTRFTVLCPRQYLVVLPWCSLSHFMSSGDLPSVEQCWGAPKPVSTFPYFLLSNKLWWGLIGIMMIDYVWLDICYGKLR
jgi:hypothetical protein